MEYEAIVIGVSAGGTRALTKILPELPKNFPIPIIIIQHIGLQSDGYFIEFLNKRCQLIVSEAMEKEKIKKGHIYFPPPNYHLLIELDRTFSLSVEGRVNFARPSIDVLFESAAYVYGSKLIGLILTGANRDGSHGLRKIQEMGGTIWVQDPSTAEVNSMPEAALKNTRPDAILQLDEISEKLIAACAPNLPKKAKKNPGINDFRVIHSNS